MDEKNSITNDNDDFFKLEDFDRIDICYFAFVRYQKKEEDESEKNDI